jgi:adenylate cyclase
MIAARASSPATKPDAPRVFRLRLGVALTALMLIAVLSTALIVHASWDWTASRNIETVVGSLNRQTADAVERELQSTFRGAEGAVEIVRSILFQGAIKADDEAKREFVFLSVLRSIPAASWIGFGFPDGRFFGAHARDGGEIEMVEIGDKTASGARNLRRDLYKLIPGDIFFLNREKSETSYVTLGAPWYRAANTSSGSIWSMTDILPSGFEPAAVVSTKLVLYGRFEGVLMVSLNLQRLSDFLSHLDIARNGAAVIVSKEGVVLASSTADRGAPLVEALRSFARSKDMTDELVKLQGMGQVYVTTAPLEFNGWRLATGIPRSAFTAEIDRNTERLLMFVAALALLAALAAAVFANVFFARPIRRLAGELRHIENFSLNQVKHIPTWLRELDELSAALKRMARSLSAFGLYIPTELVRQLIARGVEPKPGGEPREITVMFADLPGFTKLTERFGGDVAPFLTEFLTLATEAVHREGGTVDKFIGDCIMAFWNAPLSETDHAYRACKAANAIRAAMRNLPRPDGGVAATAVRIGINTGTALVGHVGSAERVSYTAIGDVVNVASRLESLGKEFGTEILISAATAEAISGRLPVRSLGESAIRGREGAIMVFELLPAEARLSLTLDLVSAPA